MGILPDALMNRFRKEKVQDPFGGDDDDLGGESGFALSGPQIALGVSTLLFVLLIGGVAAVIVTGEAPETQPAMMGSLADLEIVEEEPAAAGDTPQTNAVTATDRSAARRPWLNPTSPSADDQSAETTTGAPDGTAPPRETQTAGRPASPSQSGGETSSDIAASNTTDTNESSNLARLVAEDITEDDDDNAAQEEAQNQPSLADAGPAPGAPGLFDVASSEADAGTAGGRPRLVEPELPPIDRQAVSAPPPRYANLANVQSDASAASAPQSAAKIAVVVEGLGLNATATEAAIRKLPSSVTLAFSPYARDLKKWMDMAKENGHEVLIEVPMESKQFPAQDPGPLGLLTGLDEEERTERLDKILKDAEGAVGILDTMGSQYRESDQHISAVFAKLSEENLYYVQGRPGIRVGETTVPTAIADVLIDERPFRAAIDARLDYLERLARYQGSAVAAVGAKPVSFERLVLWMEQIADSDVALSPVSQVLIR